jgi:deferrochelatase/peroxidase EfeB
MMWRVSPPRAKRWPEGVPVAERGPGESYRPDDTPGPHQPGITTTFLDHVAFAALDVSALEGLGELAAEAEQRTDADLTVTLGLGASLFDGRFGLAHRRPLALRPLPAFPGDDLDPGLCDGDLALQVCARDPARADEALAGLVAAATVRWSLRASVRRRPHDNPHGRPRNLLGFKDGSINPRRGKDHDRHVWVYRGEQAWMVGGTFLVARRIEVDLEAWQALTLDEQERVIGRHRDSGAPLGATHEYDPVDDAVTPTDAHARLTSPRENGGARMLRRAYSYDTGILLLTYQRDPRRQFVPVQQRLAERDALARFSRPIGSALFAIPPRDFVDGLLR